MEGRGEVVGFLFHLPFSLAFSVGLGLELLFH